MNTNAKHRIVGLLRFLTQATALVLPFVGMGALVRTMGLPLWALLASIFLLGSFFCGWVCPLGTIQEWLGYVGKGVIGVSLRIPARINRYLLMSRYLLFPLTVMVGIAALDARRTFMMAIGGRAMETAAYCVLGAVLVLALVVERPFCKYVCGFGALAGMVSVFRLFGIKRNGELCSGCTRCDHACQMGVEVSKANNVRDPHCINCGRCLAVCSRPDALKPGVTLPCREDAAALRNKYFPPEKPAA